MDNNFININKTNHFSPSPIKHKKTTTHVNGNEDPGINTKWGVIKLVDWPPTHPILITRFLTTILLWYVHDVQDILFLNFIYFFMDNRKDSEQVSYIQRYCNY